MATQRRISAEALAEHRAAGGHPQIIDVRSPGEFDSGHLPGAINVPMETLESRVRDLDLNAPTILVCHSGDRAKVVCEKAGHLFQEVAVLEGGTQAWLKGGREVVRTTRSGKPLMQQALLGAGILNGIGVILAIFVHPAWIGLNAFVSFGLMLAGSTGICMMAMLLAVMPWNREKTGSRGLGCEAVGEGR